MSGHVTFEDRLLERLQRELPASETATRPVRRARLTLRLIAGAALVGAVATGAVVFTPGGTAREALAVEKNADGTVSVRGTMPREPREVAMALVSAGIPADVGAPPAAGAGPHEVRNCRFSREVEIRITQSRTARRISLDVDPSELRRGEMVRIVLTPASGGEGGRLPKILVCTAG